MDNEKLESLRSQVESLRRITKPVKDAADAARARIEEAGATLAAAECPGDLWPTVRVEYDDVSEVQFSGDETFGFSYSKEGEHGSCLLSCNDRNFLIAVAEQLDRIVEESVDGAITRSASALVGAMAAQNI